MKDLIQKQIYRDAWLTLRLDTFKDQAGSDRSYAVVQRADSAIVIPLLASGEIIFVREYRYPIDRQLWGLPMGGVEPDERPEAAGLRELTEETGLQATSMREIGQFHPVPGLSPQRAWVFLAEVGGDAASWASSAQDIDQARALTMSEIDRLIDDGQITDGFTLTALLLAAVSFKKDGRPPFLGM